MTIPLWFWPLFTVCLLLLLSWWETRQITRRLNDYRRIDDERRAREAAHPIGNVDRIFDREAV